MNSDFIWVEKYRPTNLNEVSAQPEVIQSLKKKIIFVM